MHRIKKILATQTIKDSFVVFLGLGVTTILGFFYTIIMARVLRPESFGVFSAITSLVAIVYSLGDFGVGPAIINFLPKQKNDSKLISTTFWFQFFVGVATTLIIWLFSKRADILIPGATTENFLLVGALSFNYLLIGWIQAVFTAKKRFSSLSLGQIIDAVLKITLVFWLLRIGNLSINTAIIANIISTFFALIITFGRDLFTINLSFDTVTLTNVFHYSKWVAISRLFSVFFSRIDIILLNLLASSYSAGIFAAASRITLLFAMVVSSLGSVVNPRFSSFGSKKEAAGYIKKLFLLITGVSGLILVTCLFAKPIILTVFGLSFTESIKIFQLLAVSMIPFLYSVIFTAAILYTFHQPKFYAYTCFLQLVVVVSTNLLLISKVGAYAPVIGSAISNTLVFIVSAYKVKWLFNTKTFKTSYSE